MKILHKTTMRFVRVKDSKVKKIGDKTDSEAMFDSAMKFLGEAEVNLGKALYDLENALKREGSPKDIAMVKVWTNKINRALSDIN